MPIYKIITESTLCLSFIFFRFSQNSCRSQWFQFLEQTIVLIGQWRFNYFDKVAAYIDFNSSNDSEVRYGIMRAWVQWNCSFSHKLIYIGTSIMDDIRFSIDIYSDITIRRRNQELKHAQQSGRIAARRPAPPSTEWP